MAIDVKNNKIIISLSEELYPLEAIYGTCYVFLDRVYVFLDKDKNNIIITLKGKEKLSQKELEKLLGEFNNELLNYSLRYQISTRNQKIREYIIGRALVGALKGDEVEETIVNIEKEGIESDNEQKEDATEEWCDDSLGIAIPWEEKYKVKSKPTMKNKAKKSGSKS